MLTGEFGPNTVALSGNVQQWNWRIWIARQSLDFFLRAETADPTDRDYVRVEGTCSTQEPQIQAIAKQPLFKVT